MNTNQKTTNSRQDIPLRRKSRAPLYAVIALLVLGGAGVGAWAYWGMDDGADAIAPGDIHVVTRGPLTVSIRQGGTIHHRDKIIVKSKLEGSSTIIMLIDEGKRVNEGDLLLELDSSGFEQKREQQEIVVINSEADLISAREALVVTKNAAQTAINDAKLAIDLADLDLRKYLGDKLKDYSKEDPILEDASSVDEEGKTTRGKDEGEYAQLFQEAAAAIEIAKEQLTRARDRELWSAKLAAEGFLTPTELKADELASKQAAINLTTARSKLQVLKKYTYVRKVAELKNNLVKAKAELEPVERKASADIRQAEAKLKAQESEHKQQLILLEKSKAQIKECKVYAPVGGEVVYATTTSSRHRHGSSSESLTEGSTVYERRELFHMPGEDKIMMAVTSIPQASRNKVIDHETKLLRNLPCRITIDEVKDKYFPGTLAKMAPMPSQADWFQSTKVFATEVHVNEVDNDLRPGYSCNVEIIVAQYDDVLSVPLQAVHKVKGKPTVHVLTDTGSEARTVEIGLDNNRMVHIKSGLKEGDKVLLSPPLGEAEVDTREPNGNGNDNDKATTKPATRGRGAGAMGGMTEEMRKKYEKMTPEEKKAFIKKMRAAGGAGGGKPTGQGRPAGGRPGGGGGTQGRPAGTQKRPAGGGTTR